MLNTPEVSPVVSATEATQSQSPWWRHGMVWLVISGPLSVVVASLVSGFIAWHGADPVLTREEGPDPAAIKAGADAMTPALPARNHAATTKP
jgi:hypothetical protein